MRKSLLLILFNLFLIPGLLLAAEPKADKIRTDTTNFNNNLGVGDTTVQAALDTIDNLTISGASVSDTAYGVSWDGVTTIAPSKNAIYDKIETIGSGDVTDVGDCATGACFTGTSGNTVTFKGLTSGTIALKPAAIAGTNTLTMPAETGNVVTSVTALGGDASGTVGAVVVTDDSHAHTSTTISGVDISADTNLAVTAPVVLTGDTLSLTILKDLVTTAPLTGGTDDVFPGADADITLALTVAKDIVAGVGLSGGEDNILPGADADTTLTLDLTEINSATFGSGTFTTLVFDAGITDPTFTFSSNSIAITNAATLTNAGNALSDAATAFGGDVTGTIGATVVGDDSHAHTTTTLAEFGTMTATSGNILVADGVDFESVAMSADATIAAGGAVTVGDDTHAHTTTTLSGIDISADTNLFGDTENVLTGDALSIGAGITRDTEWDTSSEISTAVTDETGSGALVFANAPALTGTTTAVSINASDTVTGVIVVATASLSVSQGASPTVNEAGEIAVDTTDDQLIYYGGAKRVIPYEQTKCAVIEDLAAADDNFAIGMFNDAVTITGVGVHCDGTCTTAADIDLSDRAGNAMTHGAPTVSTTTGSTTFTAVTAANGLTAGEGLEFSVANAVSPETDTYTICYTFTVDAQ